LAKTACPAGSTHFAIGDRINLNNNKKLYNKNVIFSRIMRKIPTLLN
jgi:hypothetical protein